MKIVIPRHIQDRLIKALRKAGSSEIGGILMGEHYDVDEFHVVSVSIQTEKGTVTSFVRLLSHAAYSLRRFFGKTQKHYTRYNYLGEWHSHPSFSSLPSPEDIISTSEIAQDKRVGAHFVVLVIVKLSSSHSLEGSATAFFPNSQFVQCNLTFS